MAFKNIVKDLNEGQQKIKFDPLEIRKSRNIFHLTLFECHLFPFILNRISLNIMIKKWIITYTEFNYFHDYFYVF